MLSKLKHGIWIHIGHYPTALPLFKLFKIITGKRIGVVNKHTEIVIEGYPRSANTFAVVAFTLAQSRPVKIAHHLHAPAQIIRAACAGVPTLVLIREPIDAVISHVIRQPYLSLRQTLKNYIHFYNKISPYKNKYVLATFEEVINNYGEAIKRVNTRFGTNFSVFETTKENIQRCYELIDEMDRRDTGYEKVTTTTVARPSHKKEKLKAHLKKKLGRTLSQDLICRAKTVYQQMIQDRGQQK